LAYVKIVNEEEAAGTLAEDYAFISGSYSRLLGSETPTPQVYRTNSVVPAYFRFGAVQNRVLTNNGEHGHAPGLEQVPEIMVMFAISKYSACFY